MKKLIHQTQPTGATCVDTCVAMLLGQPVESVMGLIRHIILRIEDEEGICLSASLKVLNHLGMEYFTTEDDDFEKPGWHIVTVPSLNLPDGHYHAILIYLDENRVPQRVYDPAAGFEGSRYYVLAGDYTGELAVEFDQYYMEPVRISPKMG